MAREPHVGGWVFVLGCYNSGTTLLSRILGTHPGVTALPQEGSSLTTILVGPEELGWPRMWLRCEGEILRREAGLTTTEMQTLRRHWAPWLPRSSERVVEKSVSNVLRIELLNDTFPEARFVHIVRNGYAVAEGIRRRARPGRRGNPEFKGEYPIDLCARQWRSSYERVHAVPGEIPIVEIRYEDLVREPSNTLRTVTDFLEIRPLPAAALGRSWSFQEYDSGIVDMNAGSLSRLNDTDVAAIHAAAGELLDQLGYAP